MRLPLLVLLFVVHVASPVAPLAASEIEPGTPVVTGVNDGEWRGLFERLAPRGPLSAGFTELRYFPFRQRPVVLEGRMRLDPTLGLSLHYTKPAVRTLVVDDQGMLQRDAGGVTQVMPADPQGAAMRSVLLPVLQFDQEQIFARFDIHAARRADEWRLDFSPKDATVARSLGRLTAWGRGEVLERLELRRSEQQRVEIVIDRPVRGIAFTDAEVARYFR